ncbi:hypothetical protein HPC49_25370 [Pyxidicoccus fallax]|uniref:Lipoprotein n=1 Tax=Pyxidicoccus fallax TaxID=394095 RepID=A0A848LIH9_9BACT|nr:hypothetical protein [Pyxidicoccus fallax]NMO17525.1 hypothetical protein [Pyxidicoccus fallax]NPC81542.1 hypothetical protein [Pyxidicoccus fallax]
MRSVVVIAAVLGLGTGCGGVVEEQPESLPEEAVEIQEAAAEAPRKLDDLIAALDREEGVLHTLDTEQGTALAQLKAVRIDSERYQMKDELTGDTTVFRVLPYPGPRWWPLFKLCPNGQYVFSWLQCPTNIYSDRLTRIWRNSSCSWRVQNAGWSSCTTTSTGTSYKYQYMEAWKCGVGTGFCVERRAVRTVRWNYDLAACDPAIVTGVTPSAYDYLCKP